MATATTTRSDVEITLTLNQDEADWLRYLTGDTGCSADSVNQSIWNALAPVTTYKPPTD